MQMPFDNLPDGHKKHTGQSSDLRQTDFNMNLPEIKTDSIGGHFHLETTIYDQDVKPRLSQQWKSI